MFSELLLHTTGEKKGRIRRKPMNQSHYLFTVFFGFSQRTYCPHISLQLFELFLLIFLYFQFGYAIYWKQFSHIHVYIHCFGFIIYTMGEYQCISYKVDKLILLTTSNTETKTGPPVLVPMETPDDQAMAIAAAPNKQQNELWEAAHIPGRPSPS